MEAYRNWDGDSDCDWVLRCSSRDEAVAVVDLLWGTDFYPRWDNNCAVYLDGVTVLGCDAGISEIENLLMEAGHVYLD